MDPPGGAVTSWGLHLRDGGFFVAASLRRARLYERMTTSGVVGPVTLRLWRSGFRAAKASWWWRGEEARGCPAKTLWS